MERKSKGTDQRDLLTAMMKEDINCTQVKIRGVKDTHSLTKVHTARLRRRVLEASTRATQATQNS